MAVARVPAAGATVAGMAAVGTAAAVAVGMTAVAAARASIEPEKRIRLTVGSSAITVGFLRRSGGTKGRIAGWESRALSPEVRQCS